MSPPARRVAAFLSVAALLQVSPFLVQVLRVREVPLVQGWRMYRKTGSAVCAVRFQERLGDGSTAPLDYESVAGRRAFSKAADAEAKARAFCKAHPGRDVRAVVRCGHHIRGWVDEKDGSEPLCPGGETP